MAANDVTLGNYRVAHFEQRKDLLITFNLSFFFFFFFFCLAEPHRKHITSPLQSPAV
jgi:hypothetical protein